MPVTAEAWEDERVVTDPSVASVFNTLATCLKTLFPKNAT